MNSVNLIGRLVRDPELRMSQTGTGVVRFSLAVERIRKVEGQPEADFINCVAFGKTAEFMSMYLHKGYLVSVEGSIQTGHYDNKQTGQTVYTTVVVCNSVQNLTPRNNEPKSSPVETTIEDGCDVLDITSDDLPF